MKGKTTCGEPEFLWEKRKVRNLALGLETIFLRGEASYRIRARGTGNKRL